MRFAVRVSRIEECLIVKDVLETGGAIQGRHLHGGSEIFDRISRLLELDKLPQSSPTRLTFETQLVSTAKAPENREDVLHSSSVRLEYLLRI